MAVGYSVIADPLGSSRHIARMHFTGSAGTEDIADRAVRMGSTVTKADLVAVMEDIVQACTAMLLEGQRVNLGGLVEFFPRITGVFDGPDDVFDKSRHSVDLGANPGRRIRRDFRRGAKLVKRDPVHTGPTLTQLIDSASGSSSRLTPGGIALIHGDRLKFNPQRDDEGIFLRRSGNKAAPRRLADAATNLPKRLVFLVPSGLESGSYTLEVRNRQRNSGVLRSGRLMQVLQVKERAEG